ncbi:MAG: preprotein translocase subunit SecA [Planctomycetia bacterium]
MQQLERLWDGLSNAAAGAGSRLERALTGLFGSSNARYIRRLEPKIEAINSLEPKVQAMTDAELRGQTADFRRRLEAGETLDDILVEAFAVCREGGKRFLGMRHYDVQLIGGMVLHSGAIAEMITGEGKTLVATLPAYLNAIEGKGVHVVTVNDYLARRDMEWMGPLYMGLGLTVGAIQSGMDSGERQKAYACDITYGTNNEFGFDYLRDNMRMAARGDDRFPKHMQQSQGFLNFAIVDEVDNILIDEARTPLIISGPAVVSVEQKYREWKPTVERLVRKQREFCDGLLKEAEGVLQQLKGSPKNAEELERQLSTLLYRAKLGQPKSEALMRFFEDPANQKRVHQFEVELHTDQSKKLLYAEKEQLYFAIEEKSHEADLTERGRAFISPTDPEAFVLPDLATAFSQIDGDATLELRTRLERKKELQAAFEERAQVIHAISQLLKAYSIYERDVQYVVQNNKVIIVDEHTGRLMTGRRWSDGLHQAVEAKEDVEIERETQTLATITIQNYFRLYLKLAGMTGTAETEAQEFFDIYKLGVMTIPTNRSNLRKDRNDSVYKTRREKFTAVISEIREMHKLGRPVLVGTISVDTSEMLSRALKKEGLVHAVLNAKYHEQEAEIVTRAGQKGAITIATNMAGRGTDIKLGEGVSEVGGLHVLGTERHESRRIDRQLRGRCSRQGDPGSSHFFISLEDDLMRLFGSDRITRIMERMGLEEGQELEHPLLNRSIEQAQKRVEQHHFQQRKRTLEFDDVMNKQREVIYGFRNDIIQSDDVRDLLMDVMEEVVLLKVQEFSAADTDPGEWNLRGLADWVNLTFPLGLPEDEILKVARDGKQSPVAGSLFDGLSDAQFAAVLFLSKAVRDAYELKVSLERPEALASLERYTVLSAIDRLWQEHLYAMDSLRSHIGLRAYGQRDPLIEYKAEAFKLFDELMINIKSETCSNIFRSASSLMAFEQFLHSLPQVTIHQTASAFSEAAAQEQAAANGPGSEMVTEANEALAKSQPMRSNTPRVGRNDPCPCGSGKTFKSCHGR